MRKLRYHLVDVFTNQPFGGNQLAVFTETELENSTVHCRMFAPALGIAES